MNVISASLGFSEGIKRNLTAFEVNNDITKRFCVRFDKGMNKNSWMWIHIRYNKQDNSQVFQN